MTIDDADVPVNVRIRVSPTSRFPRLAVIISIIDWMLPTTEKPDVAGRHRYPLLVGIDLVYEFKRWRTFFFFHHGL